MMPINPPHKPHNSEHTILLYAVISLFNRIAMASQRQWSCVLNYFLSCTPWQCVDLFYSSLSSSITLWIRYVTSRTSLELDWRSPAEIIFAGVASKYQRRRKGKICPLPVAKCTRQGVHGKIRLANYARQNLPGRFCHVPPLSHIKRRFGFLDEFGQCFVAVVILDILNHR